MKSLSNPLEIVRGMTSSVVLVFVFVGKDRVCSSDIALTKKAPDLKTLLQIAMICVVIFYFHNRYYLKVENSFDKLYIKQEERKKHLFKK